MAALYEEMSGPRYLASSISSLSTSRQQASQIAKSYRQAAQLFLTRRLPEALSTIEPTITPPVQDDINGDSAEAVGYAPIANASRGTRIKVWSFYLTFLNAVVELGAEEGKHAFGSARWKQLVSKCRDGSVWDDVVRDGYAGVEGDVDADVVVNLATLLLTHSPSQRLNQQKLETYLSASTHPTLDISSHLSSPTYLQRKLSRRSRHGADTPRDLNTRIKLLELYALHVLPRNEEWVYAREFITMSEDLDDERKEAFLLALHSLKEEKQDIEAREEKLRQQQREQMEQRQRESEAQRLEKARAEEERKRCEEESRRQPKSSEERLRKTSQAPSQSSQTSRQPAKRSLTPPPSFLDRASTLLMNLQTMISSTANQLSTNPMAFFRTILFLVAFALAFGRRDLRERIFQIIRNVWNKVRQTIGMGTKVSYI